MASAQLFRSQLCAVLPFVALVWAVKATEMDPEWPPAPPFLPHFRPVSHLISFTNATVRNSDTHGSFCAQWQGFHIPQPNGLQMHDPSGNIQLPDGTYHVFTFPDWKHYSSTDLAHWEAQNNTAIPGSTGSSTVRQDGSIVGVTAQGDVTLFLAQDNATCVGGSCLSNWSVLSPSAARAPDDERLTSAGFRDPSRPFRGPDGRWYMIVGGGEAGVCARALVFQSRDETLTNFTYYGVLLSANHTASAGDAAGFFDMFECPDFFPLLVEGSKGESQTYFVFISSCYLSAQDPYPKYGYHNAVSYWIGRWSPTDSEDGNSSGEVALDIVARGVLDWGKVGYYSAKSMGNAKLDQVSKVRLMGEPRAHMQHATPGKPETTNIIMQTSQVGGSWIAAGPLSLRSVRTVAIGQAARKHCTASSGFAKTRPHPRTKTKLKIRLSLRPRCARPLRHSCRFCGLMKRGSIGRAR